MKNIISSPNALFRETLAKFIAYKRYEEEKKENEEDKQRQVLERENLNRDIFVTGALVELNSKIQRLVAEYSDFADYLLKITKKGDLHCDTIGLFADLPMVERRPATAAESEEMSRLAGTNVETSVSNVFGRQVYVRLCRLWSAKPSDSDESKGIALFLAIPMSEGIVGKPIVKWAKATLAEYGYNTTLCCNDYSKISSFLTFDYYNLDTFLNQLNLPTATDEDIFRFFFERFGAPEELRK